MKNAKYKILSLHAAMAVSVVFVTASWSVTASLPIIMEASQAYAQEPVQSPPASPSADTTATTVGVNEDNNET